MKSIRYIAIACLLISTMKMHGMQSSDPKEQTPPQLTETPKKQKPSKAEMAEIIAAHQAYNNHCWETLLTKCPHLLEKNVPK
jgi:hypothetical protein